MPTAGASAIRFGLLFQPFHLCPQAQDFVDVGHDNSRRVDSNVVQVGKHLPLGFLVAEIFVQTNGTNNSTFAVNHNSFKASYHLPPRPRRRLLGKRPAGKEGFGCAAIFCHRFVSGGMRFLRMSSQPH